MEDCSRCKWRMNFDEETRCLLGRSPQRCGGAPARRGDDELADRLLDLQDGQRDELKERLKHMDARIRKLASAEVSDKK